ncbi:DMT family transporter [Shouchella rhizosphaerae]
MPMAIVFVLCAAMLWGTTGTAQAFLIGAHPLVVGAARLLLGGMSLLMFAILTGKSLNIKGWPKWPFFVSIAAMAAYQPFFFTAVSMTGVAAGTVIAIGSAPIVAGLLEWAFFKRVPGKRWMQATALAIAGCVLLMTAGDQSVVVSPLGLLFAIGAGLSFAAYTLASKGLLAKGEPEVVVAFIFSFSAIVLLPTFFLFEVSWLLHWQNGLVVLHLGLLATGLAYMLFAKGLKEIPGSLAVTLALAEPLTAALLGVSLVGESLSFYSWGGIALLLLGLLLASIAPKQTQSKRSISQ